VSLFEKLSILGTSAEYDVCSAWCGNSKGRPAIPGVYHSKLPNGKSISILKTLMTNECSNDCRYCMNRAGRKCGKATFTPREVTDIFENLKGKNIIQGLFLSSGLGKKNPTECMENIVEAARILRVEKKFNGYIHLKVLPGADYSIIREAAHYADRLSINLEAPNSSRARELSSVKEFRSDVLRRMSWISGLERQGLIKSGHTTQFVVGASGESDLELIRASSWLYEKMRLRRTYFSAFEPVEETPLATHAPTPKTRAHRLYQCDFLARDYGWNTGMIEQALDDYGFLNLNEDPKAVFAKKNKDLFPVDVNAADYRTLLLVPGIGPTGAKRIIEARKENGSGIETLRQLPKLGIIINRARPFIELNGNRQASILDFGM